MLEAAKWWHKAAVNGDAAAQFALGLVYIRGEVVTRNIKKAVRWWYLSANQGFERAKKALHKLRLIVIPR